MELLVEVYGLEAHEMMKSLREFVSLFVWFHKLGFDMHGFNFFFFVCCEGVRPMRMGLQDKTKLLFTVDVYVFKIFIVIVWGYLL
jgi:hypothetical protein